MTAFSDEQREELKKLFRDAAEETAHRALVKLMLTLGVDVTKPLEVQEDMHWVRMTRKGSKALRVSAFAATIGTVITALGTLVYLGLAAVLGR